MIGSFEDRANAMLDIIVEPDIGADDEIKAQRQKFAKMDQI